MEVKKQKQRKQVNQELIRRIKQLRTPYSVLRTPYKNKTKNK